MPKVTCPCGSQYRIADSAIGKSAQCKRCGRVFQLAPDDLTPIPIAEEPVHEEQNDAFDPAAQSAAQGTIYAPPGSPAAALKEPPQPDAVVTAAPRLRSFRSDLLSTLLFPSSPGNLMTYLVLWGVLVFAWLCSYVPLVGWIAPVIAFAWYSAFRFEVAASAAAGDDDLPEIMGSADPFEDFFAPLFKWFGSWALVLLPALVYLFYAWNQGILTGFDVQSIFSGGFGALFQPANRGMLVFTLLVCIGVFCWPIVVLCIAIGGFASLSRLDLILLTILRSFGAYAMIVFLVLVALSAEKPLVSIAAGRLAAPAGGGGAAFGNTAVLMVLSTGINIYVNVVAMRFIGLYYHHFKEKFAWSWE